VKNEKESLINNGVSSGTGNNLPSSSGYQGFHTTKAKKLKEGNITSDKFGEPKKYERDNSANSKPFRTPSGTINSNGISGHAGSGR
jgi:hypothetical protein